MNVEYLIAHNGLHTPYKSELSVQRPEGLSSVLRHFGNTNHSSVSFFQGKLIVKLILLSGLKMTTI